MGSLEGTKSTNQWHECLNGRSSQECRSSRKGKTRRAMCKPIMGHDFRQRNAHKNVSGRGIVLSVLPVTPPPPVHGVDVTSLLVCYCLCRRGWWLSLTSNYHKSKSKSCSPEIKPREEIRLGAGHWTQPGTRAQTDSRRHLVGKLWRGEWNGRRITTRTTEMWRKKGLGVAAGKFLGFWNRRCLATLLGNGTNLLWHLTLGLERSEVGKMRRERRRNRSERIKDQMISKICWNF